MFQQSAGGIAPSGLDGGRTLAPTHDNRIGVVTAVRDKWLSRAIQLRLAAESDIVLLRLESRLSEAVDVALELRADVLIVGPTFTVSAHNEMPPCVEGLPLSCSIILLSGSSAMIRRPPTRAGRTITVVDAFEEPDRLLAAIRSHHD